MEIQAKPGRGRTDWGKRVCTLSSEALRFILRAVLCQGLGVVSPGRGRAGGSAVRWGAQLVTHPDKDPVTDPTA